MIINYIELLKNNPQYFKQFSCKELLFLNYDCPVKENRLTIWSEHNYFYYVISGKKNLHANGRVWELQQGSFIFVKKGACLIEQFFREPFCIVVFVVPDTFISQYITLYKNELPAPTDKVSDALVLPLAFDDVLQNFCNSIMGFFTASVKPSESLIELKFLELLLNLSSNASNSEFVTYLHQVANRQASSIESIMEANFSFKLELEDYAKLCNRSLSSFKRDFSALYQCPPGKWLLEKRLQHAGKLLSTTNKSLADVIFESGFENHAHFTRVFKNKFGLSPLQYKKQHHLAL
ncbi:AraC family transcriptional regulator [Flavihumibacter rivuli]|uniref:helix-turn-helix domain-containing protein n=1 Tax=Flavihumibacter rivuli TaxID=2838156 RepID=UPI001BDE444B|nr:AraC family transcriptional regulator [Flavihumibacter rivuli]ULQ54907.1 AraC family transcriptional regulator [Flavihumibacter rivuli]